MITVEDVVSSENMQQAWQMSRVSRRVKDKDILKLIGMYLRAGVVVNGRPTQTTKGVPQGGPLSPLLSNILLDDLDKQLEKRGHQFCR